jgi:hypothetical protein
VNANGYFDILERQRDEGNNEEENNGYIVFKGIIHGSPK